MKAIVMEAKWFKGKEVRFIMARSHSSRNNSCLWKQNTACSYTGRPKQKKEY